MLTVGRGSILFWEGACIWVINNDAQDGGPLMDTKFHSHHAVQVTLALSGGFELANADPVAFQ
jgi:hypothetical protein